MKTSKFIMTVSVIALMITVSTSCAKENGSLGGDDSSVAANFTPTIATRASGITWSAGDKVGIIMYDRFKNIIGGYANKEYYTNADGTKVELNPEDGIPIYYPMDGSSVLFSAYYPYSAAVSGNNFLMDISDQDDVESIDLLFVKTSYFSKTDPGPITLSFKHKMSKFIIKTKADANVNHVLTGMEVKVKGVKSSNNFYIIDGAFQSANAPNKDIVPRNVKDGEHYEALLFPGVYTNPRVVFTVNSEDFTFNMPENYQFEEGKEYIWEITLKRTGVEGFEASIQPWVGGNNGTGDAK